MEEGPTEETKTSDKDVDADKYKGKDKDVDEGKCKGKDKDVDTDKGKDKEVDADKYKYVQFKGNKHKDVDEGKCKGCKGKGKDKDVDKHKDIDTDNYWDFDESMLVECFYCSDECGWDAWFRMERDPCLHCDSVNQEKPEKRRRVTQKFRYFVDPRRPADSADGPVFRLFVE